MRTQDTFLHTSNCVAHVKTAAIFIPAGMEITAVLYFLRNGVKLHFYSLGTIFAENMRGVQVGAAPWRWVSNRGEKHPCRHTILLASLMCYTFCGR